MGLGVLCAGYVFRVESRIKAINSHDGPPLSKQRFGMELDSSTPPRSERHPMSERHQVGTTVLELPNSLLMAPRA